VLGMVDGAVLLVDANEGPLSQTKFVVEKALQDYSKAKSREDWVMVWQGQAVLAVDCIYWTSLAEEAMKKSGMQGLQ
jgi:hypothetical protein